MMTDPPADCATVSRLRLAICEPARITTSASRVARDASPLCIHTTVWPARSAARANTSANWPSPTIAITIATPVQPFAHVYADTRRRAIALMGL
jgi:hypothetical protein